MPRRHEYTPSSLWLNVISGPLLTSGDLERCSALSLTGEFHCSFEDEPICMFTQDKNDDFDWTRHSAATRDSKYTPNTGPSADRAGSKQGKERLSLILHQHYLGFARSIVSNMLLLRKM